MKLKKQRHGKNSDIVLKYYGKKQRPTKMYVAKLLQQIENRNSSLKPPALPNKEERTYTHTRTHTHNDNNKLI